MRLFCPINPVSVTFLCPLCPSLNAETRNATIAREVCGLVEIEDGAKDLQNSLGTGAVTTASLGREVEICL